MSDLIDRQTLKERLMYMARFRCNSEIGEPTWGLTRRTAFHMSEIMKVVINMPTAEKTGHWTEVNIPDESPYFRRRWYCSNCGDWQTYGEPKFCPMCGARMEVDR